MQDKRQATSGDYEDAVRMLGKMCSLGMRRHELCRADNKFRDMYRE